MYKFKVGATAIVTALLLAGCEPGGPDLTGVTGTGTASDPYVLPAENQPGLRQGIEDYLDEDGSWKFPYDDIEVLVDGTTLPAFGDIVYDTQSDMWTVTIDGVQYVLSVAGDVYASADCSGGPGTCVELSSFDKNASTSQYGTFGAIHVDDGTDVSVAQIFYGLKTPVADMPTGTATYNGNFQGQIVLLDGTTYDAASTATLNANFGAPSPSISLSSTGSVMNSSSVTVGQYSVSGVASISGNSYSGTATGTFTPTVGTAIDFDSSGTMAGAFYGPAADETAGALTAESGGGDLLYGGFWGTQ
jgi:hypothetical protein